jgi:hypothetical protein
MPYFGQKLVEQGLDAECFSNLDGKATIFNDWIIHSFKIGETEIYSHLNYEQKPKKNLVNFTLKSFDFARHSKQFNLDCLLI